MLPSVPDIWRAFERLLQRAGFSVVLPLWSQRQKAVERVVYAVWHGTEDRTYTVSGTVIVKVSLEAMLCVHPNDATTVQQLLELLATDYRQLRFQHRCVEMDGACHLLVTIVSQARSEP